MPVSPCSCSHSLVFWKGPQPMNGRGGRRADSGEGWLAFSTSNGPRGGCACSSACLDCAWEPHSRKTLGRGSFSTCVRIASVMASHPRLACDAGLCASTVSEVLSSKAPWRAQRSRLLRWRANASWYRSEEQTSELQALIRNSYAAFCLKKKKTRRHTQITN